MTILQKLTTFRRWCQAAVLAALFFVPEMAWGQARLKDVARVGGAREIELIGYGLVTGLNGTGDKAGSNPTVPSLVSMLKALGVSVPPADVNAANVAAVAVTARVPLFSSVGSVTDASVSSVGSATSFRGGVLLLTPLRGIDNKVYATAQGRIQLENADAARGNSKEQESPTASGVVTAGVLLERSPMPESPTGGISLDVLLLRPDAVTAERIAAVARDVLGTDARAISPGLVRVDVPPDFRGDPVAFSARLESLTVEPDETAKVIINGMTGTVVADKNVTILPVAVSHGSLKIDIADSKDGEGTTVASLVALLNRLGATPRDVAAIFQTLKRVGALRAELVIM